MVLDFINKATKITLADNDPAFTETVHKVFNKIDVFCTCYEKYKWKAGRNQIFRYSYQPETFQQQKCSAAQCNWWWILPRFVRITEEVFVMTENWQFLTFWQNKKVKFWTLRSEKQRYFFSCFKEFVNVLAIFLIVIK